MPAPVGDFIVEEIKEALRKSPDHASVNATAIHYARDVMKLEQSKDATHNVMAIQIKNLAKYRRLCISKEWG